MFASSNHARIRRSFVLILFSLVVANFAAAASEFFSDFNSGIPPRASLLGTAAVTEDGGNANSGALKLTTAEQNQVGSFALEPLDGKTPVRAFTAEFKMLMGGGSGGDGLGFMFHKELPKKPFKEQETGRSVTGISVVFDSFRNRLSQVAPAVRVYFNQTELAAVPMSNLRQNHFVDVRITLNAAGEMNLMHDGQLVISNLLAGKINMAGQFGFGARTATAYDNHFIDDLRIVTETSNPNVEWAEPTDDNASPKPMIRIGLKKSKRINDKSFTLTLDEKPLSHRVAAEKNLFVVSAEPDDLLEPGTTHAVNLTFGESKETATNSYQFQFTISKRVQLSR